MERDAPFAWTPGAASDKEPTPHRRTTATTPPRAHDGASCSPLGKTHDVAKEGVKLHEAVVTRHVNARDAAITSVVTAILLPYATLVRTE